MNTRKTNAFAAIVAVSLLAAGCATTQEGKDQAMGAGAGLLGGAALGCLTGFIASGDAGGCATGAAIGAATGAVAGWAAVKLSQYQASQVRTVQEEQRLYGLAKPVSSTQVKIRKGMVAPSTVKPGQTVSLNTDYSVILPASQPSTLVTESWTLKKDNKVLLEIPGQQGQRTSGGWSAGGAIPIPGNVTPGTYVVEHKVQSGDSYDTDDSVFVVAK